MDLPAIAVIGSASADLFTTELALADGGFHEFNPILDNRAVRIGVKTLATVAVLGAGKELKRRGHTGAAKAVLWATAGAWTGAALWNLKQGAAR